MLSDEWCRRSDDAICGMDCVKKLVDDILVVANSKEELLRCLKNVLDKCHVAGITLSKHKFEIGQLIGFAGYCLLLDGIRPNKRKLKGISEFPIPTDLSKLRSFFGLANQLANFIPNLASLTDPLRMLLHKDNSFTCRTH